MRAKKSLGQNFLFDQNIAKKIVKQTILNSKNVIEIGPGYGFLTDMIIKEKPKKLFLYEKDSNISFYLKKKYRHTKNITVVNEDILNSDLNYFNKVIIIANLPYNISTKIIRKIFKLKNNFNEMIVMVQKEVGLKFDFKLNPINKYSFLTALCSKYERCFNVSQNVFYPKPKVESSVVKFTFNKDKIDWIKTDNFINKIFINKRKKINKKICIKEKESKKTLDKRIDELNLEDILKIYNSF